MAWLGLNGSVLDAEMYRTFKRERLKMVTAKMIREQGAVAAVRQVMETVASGVDAVYLTVDIDVVNGGEARGTGAPVFNGIEARTLAGHESIAWSDVAAIRRARTTWGRMTVHVIARSGAQIEVAETIPGFDELAVMLRRPWLSLAA
jgi:arginase family enzyme